MSAVLQIEDIGALAVEAMLYEVSATPKPGLVDRHDNGAHHDMDFFTFMSSAAGLRGAFDEFSAIGRNNQAKPLKELLPLLKTAGIKAETDMFAMTKGVNTHKGMIFSLGLLTGVAGWIKDGDYRGERLCALVGEMCQGLCRKAYDSLAGRPLTKGEQMYLKYGITGVRGEAEKGFLLIQQITLPLYRSLRQKKLCINDALVAVLIQLMAVNDDTNIMGRHDKVMLLRIKNAAQKIINLGSINTAEGRREIEKLNDFCIEAYVSPGGSADMVAVTHFLYEIENKIKYKGSVV